MGAPLYAFHERFVEENPTLKTYFEGQALLRGFGISGGNDGAFYLGAPGTGAQWHINARSMNVLAYGRKRWLLMPPGVGNYTIKTAVQSLQEDYVPDVSLECVQESGDILLL